MGLFDWMINKLNKLNELTEGLTEKMDKLPGALGGQALKKAGDLLKPSSFSFTSKIGNDYDDEEEEYHFKKSSKLKRLFMSEGDKLWEDVVAQMDEDGLLEDPDVVIQRDIERRRQEENRAMASIDRRLKGKEDENGYLDVEDLVDAINDEFGIDLRNMSR